MVHPGISPARPDHHVTIQQGGLVSIRASVIEDVLTAGLLVQRVSFFKLDEDFYRFLYIFIHLSHSLRFVSKTAQVEVHQHGPHLFCRTHKVLKCLYSNRAVISM